MTQETRRAFTWRRAYTDMINKLRDDDMATVVRAVTNYGTYGIEPESELEYPLGAIFAVIKWDIDHPEAFDEAGNIIDDLAEEE